MIKDLLIGIAIIIFGFYAIYSTYKNPNKTFWSSDFKGYAGGVIFIIGGVLYLLRNLHIINW